MRLLAATAILAMISAPAFAKYERYPYYSTSVSCSEIQEAINDAGALVIYRAPHLYDAYATHDHFCQGHRERAERTTIPAADGACPVKKCTTYDRD